jgi:MFS family permease
MNPEIRQAWRFRDLRVLVLGEGVSMFGSLVARLALPWTAARELRQGTLAVGFVLLAELLPAVVLGLFAGVMVDRWERRTVLIATNAGLAAATMVIPILSSTGHLTMGWIYAVGGVSGCIVPFFRAAFRSMVPITVPTAALAGAQSIVQGVSAVAEVVAFAAAGWLVHFFGGPTGLGIDAATFVWAAGMASQLRATPPALHERDRTDVLDELRAGVRYVRGHPVLGPVAWSGLVAGIGSGMTGAVIIVHITKTLGYGTGPQGIVYALGGVASLIGAAFAPRVLAWLGLTRSLTAALLLSVPTTALVAFAPGPSVRGYAMLASQQLLFDPVGTLSMIAFGTVIAAGAPEHMRGRVESTTLVLATFGISIGFVVGGYLGEPSRLGTLRTLFTAGVVAGLSAFCLTGRNVRRVRVATDVHVLMDTGVA